MSEAFLPSLNLRHMSSPLRLPDPPSPQSRPAPDDAGSSGKHSVQAALARAAQIFWTIAGGGVRTSLVVVAAGAEAGTAATAVARVRGHQ